MRKERGACGRRTRKIISAKNSSTNAGVYSKQVITAKLRNGSAANTAVIPQKIRMATLGTPVLGETSEITRGSQPSSAITNGKRETYRSCALKSAHIETIPAAATSAPSHGPPINREITGHPASVFHTFGLVVTLKPASMGSK